MMAAMTEPADLQHPIGRSPRPEKLTPEQRTTAIETLAALPENLAGALSGLGETQLDTPYRPGGWTIRQLVHHLADSHMNAYARMRLAITSDGSEWPTIFAYDQAAWAELPDAYLSASISLQLLDALHRRWVATLRGLPEAVWQKGYNHPESGPTRLDQALAAYDWHSRHHLAHITTCRQRNGW